LTTGVHSSSEPTTCWLSLLRHVNHFLDQFECLKSYFLSGLNKCKLADKTERLNRARNFWRDVGKRWKPRMGRWDFLACFL